MVAMMIMMTALGLVTANHDCDDDQHDCAGVMVADRDGDEDHDE